MQKNDYTKISYYFIAVAIILVTIGSVASWSLMRTKDVFIQLNDSLNNRATTSGLQATALISDKKNFIDSFSHEMLGFISAFSSVGFLLAVFLGHSVAKHERENDEFKSQIISIAAHQLRAPITVVRGYLDLLASTGRLNKEQRDLLNKTDNSAANTLEVISDLIDLSKIDLGQYPLQPKNISLNQMIEEIAEELQILATAKKITIQFISMAKNTTVFLDEQKIGQAIRNVVENAIKYSYEKTKIQITLEERNNFAVLAVKNNGIGIPKEDQKKIFQRFYRASNTRKMVGSGLGLFIVKAIIEQSNGTITCTSEEGKETIFSINLPIIRA